MQGSLLTIGDELLIGQVVNSNASWMSEKLTEINCTVRQHLTVGDRKEEISKALDYLLEKSNFIIIGGGLGPTHDDLTMEVLSDYFQLPLFYDEEWINKVDAYFKSRNRVMSENNKKQGYLFKSAIRIDNDCGTAAGQHLTVNPQGKTIEIFVVPGVPYEMKSMMERYILPEVSKKTMAAGEKILKSTLLTTGIGESALAERCDSFVQKIKKIPEISLAFLPSPTQVRLRLQTTTKNPEDEIRFQSLVEELKTYCGKDFYGFDPITLEKSIIEHLKQKKQTLAIAESCTGGLISHLLTQIPGSSSALRGSLVPYQTELKTSELGIPNEAIKTNGVVSEKVAILMAEAIRLKWGTTYGISTTGYIGPTGGDEFARLGTVWVAVSTSETSVTKSLFLENNRERNKERATQAALDLLRRLF
jgi:nicotinamide-nucleotide amidase